MSGAVRRWRLPAGWLAPRELITGGLLLAVLGPALWLVSPWILPVRVLEGPLIQNAGPSGFSLVWYTTRPAECRVRVSGAEAARFIPAVSQARRNEVRIDGLAPGQSYAYSLHAGNKPLPDAAGVARTQGAGDRLKFAVFGDSGKGFQAQYQLAARIELSEPDFLVHTGDLIYGSGERKYFNDRFFTPYRRMLRTTPFWPSLGNHDVRENGGIAYREVFSLPENGPRDLPVENNYWFDVGTARFAIFDSNLKEDVLTSSVAPWLREVMSAAGPRWRFVVCHHPPYASGRYKTNEKLQRSICPVLEECGIDILFTGHDHNYQRSYALVAGKRVEAGGVVYLVSGAGGANLYELAPQAPDFAVVRNASTLSFTEIKIEGDALHAQQIALDGSVIDEFTIQKTATAAPATQVSPPD